MTAVTLTATEPTGTADAPLVLLGPSLGTSTVLWDAAAPTLDARFRTARWDFPGHGASAPASGPFTMDDLADGVADVIARLGARRVHYVGVSLSGCVGLALLLRHPDVVDRAVICCSGAVIGTPDGWSERAAQVRAQSTSSLIIGAAERWFAPGSVAAHPEHTGRILHVLQDTDDESYARCCEALGAFDVRRRLGAVANPVLAVWGGYDQTTPEASARQIADGVQNGRARGIPDASHLAPVDAPDTVAALVTAFFDGAL